MKNIKLNNGLVVPMIGLGTWKSASEDVYGAVLEALKSGYTHIDTAMIYRNEEAIGKAIKDSGVAREDLFITTKVWNSDQGFESTLEACKLSLKKLGLDYVDLYLIHWFKGYENSLSTYKAMEQLYNDGFVKAIGVCNYNVHHIMHLLEHVSVKPMVNQVETNIELQNNFLNDYCNEHGIVLEAYAPLMSFRIKEMLENEVMIDLATKHNKTVPQVALRWLNQRGIIAIPKSITPSRIISNIDIYDFELSIADMKLITTLNKGNKMFPEMDNIPF